ncbi:hypothetical protein WA026_013329 [Henosepilachna vigintioctopunctata]|uniref:Retroviral polymerase SH3-like domain-containing protein n=1 Tax=Henosepilachna vigintioctopunctata TaxID=420089 RepID=A0AAW1VD43_9CUCU
MERLLIKYGILENQICQKYIYLEAVLWYMFPKKKEQNSIRNRSNIFYLVGFSEEIKGYRVYNPELDDVTTSRDVNIHEDLKTKIQNFTAEIQNQIPDSVGDENEHSTNSLEIRDAGSYDTPSYLQTADDSRDID